MMYSAINTSMQDISKYGTKFDQEMSKYEDISNKSRKFHNAYSNKLDVNNYDMMNLQNSFQEIKIDREKFITEMDNILNDFDDLKKDSSNDTKTNNNSNTSNLNLTITEQNSKYEENKEENKDTIDKDNIDNYNENDNDNDNENENENEDVVTKNINYNICPLCNIPGKINDTLII